MKRFLLLTIFIFLFTLTVNADSFDDFANVERMWDGQKSITNKEFEQVIEKLEEKGKQKEEKQKKKKRKKLFGSGTTLHEELNPEKANIAELDSINSEAEEVLINNPVLLMLPDTIIEKGFYKVEPEKDNNTGKKFVKFYQSQYLMGRLEVVETDDDFGEEHLNFAKIIPYNESFIKLIFGSIDFNGYALIPYKVSY